MNLINKEVVVTYGPLEGATVKVKEDEDGTFHCVLVEDRKPYKMGDEVSLELWELLSPKVCYNKVKREKY